MKAIICALACLLALSERNAATAAGALPDFQPVTLRGFDADRGIRSSSSQAEFEAAATDRRFVMEQFTYTSDGLTVGAYIYRPLRPIKRAMPVIVFNRGSTTRPNGFAEEMLVMANRYAQAGFITVAPHYRGSNGWAGRDEVGGADLSDLMNIAPQLRRIPGADIGRVFLVGESRGGMMVYQAMRDGFPARAAAVWGAFTDLDVLIAPDRPLAGVAAKIWPELEKDRTSIVERRSAIRWADRINMPVLIMHGGADKDMDIAHSTRMAAELARLGKPHSFLPFPDQGHTLGARGAERDAAILAWFRRFGG